MLRRELEDAHPRRAHDRTTRRPRSGVTCATLSLCSLASCAAPRVAEPPAAAQAAPGTIAVARLQVERRENPVGLDVATPHLSWLLEPAAPGSSDLRQSAYQVLVASSADLLASDRGDLWDSGKVVSDQSIEVPYGGSPLSSRQQVHWRVRVWDQADRPSAWSTPGTWEMALLHADDWRARWIGRPARPRAPLPADASKLGWYWVDEAPAATGAKPRAGRAAKAGGGAAPAVDGPAPWAQLRGTLRVDTLEGLTRARLLLASHDESHLHVNGTLVHAGRRRPYAIDLLPHLRAGSNLLAIELRAFKGKNGLAGQVVLEPRDGPARVVPLQDFLRGVRAEHPDWLRSDFDDRAWRPLRQAAAWGAAPFDDVALDELIHADGEPPAYLHRRVCLDDAPAGPPDRARLYATALGIYELFLNGQRVGDEHLSPGWTEYRRRLEYQTHDVTSAARAAFDGSRARCVELAATLADGWYAGWLGYQGQREIYGGYPLRLRAQLELRWPDGTVREVVTDEHWRAGEGPVREADLLRGERHDARGAIPGWPAPGAAPAGFVPVDAVADDGLPLRPNLIAAAGPPVRVVRELKPIGVREVAPGTHVFDLGQNLVGWARLKVRGPAGTRVRLRFAEILNPDGTLYTRNLRTAFATDHYVLRGDPGGELWEPRFTTHGFRYVELTGYPGTPSESSLLARVVQSDTPPAGSLRTSHPMVNQLQSNIVWGQRGNFVAVPTDCPQRDERLGWMGDAQIFARTACFNFDVSGFFARWLEDVFATQSADGGLADTVPYVDGLGKRPGAPGWVDAGVLVPWTMYQCYGDERFLSRHYDGMKRHIDLVARENPDLLWRRAVGSNYGDWLSIDAATPKDVLATAYFAQSTGLLARIAERLGHAQDAARYRDLRQRIAAAFVAAFVKDDGRVEGDTQTAYLLPLAFDLLPAERRAQAGQHLVAALERNGKRLNTGFLGVRELLPVLTELGHLDLAYHLLLSEEFPSWGYSIKHGATTIWERWDGYTAERGFQSDTMNSFNHYSLGSVGQWMYASLGGIDLAPDAPGFKHILLRPRPGGGITYAQARLRSPHGLITSDWKVQDGRFDYEVTIPVNTRATVVLPDGTRHERGSGKATFSIPWAP